MPNAKSRMLIVHHDERTLMNLQRVLESEEFDTTTAWNSKEAIVAVDEAVFDFVLIGDRPPLITASEIIFHTWSRVAHVRTTFIVAAGDRGFEAACMDHLDVYRPQRYNGPSLPPLSLPQTLAADAG